MAANSNALSAEDMRKLIKNCKREREQRRKEVPRFGRDMCPICLQEKDDINMRMFILPCGHSFCMNCICELFGIFDRKNVSVHTMAEDLRKLDHCTRFREKCPTCRNEFIFKDLLLDEDLSDMKNFRDGITFKIFLLGTLNCIDSIYVLKVESTLTISLLFFFNIFVSLRDHFQDFEISEVSDFKENMVKPPFLYPHVSLSDDDFIDECEYIIAFNLPSK